MKMNHNDQTFPVGFGGVFFAVFMLLLQLQIPGVGWAADKDEAVAAGNDALTYMMEADALRLNGAVTRVRAWNGDDNKWLGGDYFEPLVVTVDVLNQGGGCLGEHDFYLKKGLDTAALKQGDVVFFSINKNMCHPNKVLIIMDLNVLQPRDGEKR